MWRASIIALCVYTWGAPAFDGMRPQMLERAVKNFHNDVNASTRDVMLAARRVQHSAASQFATNYREAAGTMFAGQVR
jgi:hypothetical protein